MFLLCMNLETKINRRGFLKFAGGTILSVALAKAQNYTDVKIYPNNPNNNELEQQTKNDDELRQYAKLEERMGWALKYEVPRGGDKRSLPFDSSLDLPVADKARKIYLRVERPHDKLRILIGIHEDDMREKLRLGDLEVYLIHNERTRFEKKEFTILLNRAERSVIYVPVDYGQKYYEAEGEFVVKQADGLITEIIKDVGTIGKRLMLEIGDALIRRKFQIWAEELDRAAEIGGELAESKVYVYPMKMERPKEKPFSTREEKLREIIIDAGEARVLGVLVYYSAEKIVESKIIKNEFIESIFNRFAIPSKMEYEAVKIYPLDMPLSELYENMRTLK